MTINQTNENGKVTLALAGRLDTITSPELDTALDAVIDGATELCFDFNGLEYISSAGLRVLLKAQKIMNTKGKMKITGVNETIMEVFEITGFTDILTIE